MVGLFIQFLDGQNEDKRTLKPTSEHPDTTQIDQSKSTKSVYIDLGVEQYEMPIGIPAKVTHICVSRGVAHPDKRNEGQWFSPCDIAKMKLVHAMYLQARILNELIACYRANNSKRAAIAPSLPKRGNKFSMCVDELMASGDD